MVWTQESCHKYVNYDHPGECSPEKDCLWLLWLTFRQPERKSSSESDLTLKMTSAQVVETSVKVTTNSPSLKMTSAQVVETSVKVTTNSPSQDYTHPDDHNLRTYISVKLRQDFMIRIGHFHDGVTWLQLTEFILFSFSNSNFCNPSGEQRTIALISMSKQKTEGFWQL